MKKALFFTCLLSWSSIYAQEDLPFATAALKKITLFSENGDAFSPAYYKNGLVYVASPSSEKYSSLVFYPSTAVASMNQPSALQPFDRGIPTNMNLGPVTFFDNEQRILFTKNMGLNKQDKRDLRRFNLAIYEAEYKGNKWDKARLLPFNSKFYSCGHPTFSADGKTMYFVSDMPGGFGGTDLYRVEYANGNWGSPVNMGGEINSDHNELFPFVDANGRLFFASEGHRGLGGLDIFYADLTAETLKPLNVGRPVNSPQDDFGLISNDGGKSGFFSSNRENKTDAIFYFAEKDENQPPLMASTATSAAFISAHKSSGESAVTDPNARQVKGYLISQNTQHPIVNSKVFLVNESTGERLSTTSDESGMYAFVVGANDRFHIEAYVNDNSNSAESDFILTLSNVFYQYGQYELDDEAREEVEKKVVGYLREHPNMCVEVRSHTDSRSSAEFNQELSQRRADEVKLFLVQQGISPERIFTFGFGESKVLNECVDGVDCSEFKHQQNRRTEIKFVNKKL